MRQRLIRRRTTLRGLMGFVFMLGGSACGVIPTPRPAPQLFNLSPKSTFQTGLRTVDWQLGIEMPNAPAGLSSARIAVTRRPLTLEYYAASQWVDDAPAMVQRLLIESFENSGSIVGVGRLAVALRSDYVLQPELREFQAEYSEDTKSPSIRVRINAKLVKMPERRIIAANTFERVIESSDNRMPSIVRTFDEALGKVMRELVVWTIQQP